MAKPWTEDAALLSAVAADMTDALALFPQTMMDVELLLQEAQMPFSQLQLVILLSGGALSMGALAQRTGIARPNLTTLVNALCDKGLVERTRDAADHRMVTLCLSDNGHALMTQIRADVAAQMKQWPTRFNRSEIKALHSALATILRVAHALE